MRPRASVCRVAARPACLSSSPRCEAKALRRPQVLLPRRCRTCLSRPALAICSRPKLRRTPSSTELPMRSPVARTKDGGASSRRITTSHLVQRRRSKQTPPPIPVRNQPRRPSARCRQGQSGRMPARPRHRKLRPRWINLSGKRAIAVTRPQCPRHQHLRIPLPLRRQQRGLRRLDPPQPAWQALKPRPMAQALRRLCCRAACRLRLRRRRCRDFRRAAGVAIRSVRCQRHTPPTLRDRRRRRLNP